MRLGPTSCVYVLHKWIEITGIYNIFSDFVLALCVTDRSSIDFYAPAISHTNEETNNFYNAIDEILEKQAHYTIAMGDFNGKVGGQTNTSERATGCFGLGQRNERGHALVEWATSNNVKIMNNGTISEETRK